EEQAATNHILEIISQSPTEVQPVLDAIVESAAQVCGAEATTIRFRDGDLLTAAARFGPHAREDSIPIDSTNYIGTAVLERRTVVTLPQRITDKPLLPQDPIIRHGVNQ